MKDFWDLPKPVREKIFRLYLHHGSPVSYETFKGLSRSTQPATDGTLAQQIMPLLLQASYRLELEGEFRRPHSTHSPIFLTDIINSLPDLFGENTMLVSGSTNLMNWFRRLWPRHAKQIRKIVIEGRSPHAKHKNLKERFRVEFWANIRQLPLLECLVITVDEWKILHRMLRECAAPFRWHRSLSDGPQMYQHMMRATGMPAMRSLRDLQHVKFALPWGSGLHSIQNCEMQETRGSIPGGFLETVVRRQIMQVRRTEE